MVLDEESGLPERLIALADGSVADVARRLSDENAELVAEGVLAEVLSRAAIFAGPPEPVVVQFDLGVAGRRLGYQVEAGAGKVDAGWADDPWVTVRQDLAELVRTVYGPATTRQGTREILIKEEPGPASWVPTDPWHAQREAATQAAHQIVQACVGYQGDLTGLAVRFGSDKWGGHWYTPHYERHLGSLRDERVTVLEIGIGGYQDPAQGGASLRMWKHFFRRGQVHGLDVFDKSGIVEPRLNPIQGSQSDEDFLAELAAEIGPFDVIIDDGSHLSSDIITSFHALFAHLRPGGVYVIEDLQTSYWPGWEGDSEDLANPETSMGFLKNLVDGLNHKELDPPSETEPSATDTGITAIHLYHNIAFLEKGANTERTAPSWVSREQDPTSLWPITFPSA